MSTNPCETEYDMKNLPRGIFLLINNFEFEFEFNLDIPKRENTENDVNNLLHTFKYLECETILKQNLSSDGLLKVLNGYANREDHSNYDVFVCCISSHGDDGVIYATDGEMSLESLFELFKRCPALAGIPKWFIIQSCRGTLLIDESRSLDYVDGIKRSMSIQTNNASNKVPIEADFLISYSTVPGYTSFRDQNGSWYIQTLCNALNEYAHKTDICSILTRVNLIVSTTYSAESPEVPEINGCMQIPSFYSTLRKKLYLKPKPRCLSSNESMLDQDYSDNSESYYLSHDNETWRGMNND